jgi:DNA-binding GntR family transcriptional regulator
MIDRGSRVPPYQQLAGMLRTAIDRGQYPPGRRLPSAAQLRQRYGCGRHAARKALRQLVSEGAAKMSPGMGTYVKPP